MKLDRYTCARNIGTHLIFTILTCSMYNLYIQYVFAKPPVDGQVAEGARPNDSLSVPALVHSIFGLGIVARAIEQNEISQLCE